MPTRRPTAPKSLVAAPSDAELRRTLGRRFSLFDRVAHPGPAVTHEWRRYRKDAPPLLKVVEGKRTLYYVRPAADAVHVSFLMTRRACESPEARRLPAHLRAAVESAQVFPEGRAVRVALRRLAEAADVARLLAVKLAGS